MYLFAIAPRAASARRAVCRGAGGIAMSRFFRVLSTNVDAAGTTGAWRICTGHWAHPCPHRHRDWAHSCHICTGTGPTPATSAPATGPTPAHICTETGPTPAHICAGTGHAGRPFVSTIEARDVPVYGVQWHPERPQASVCARTTHKGTHARTHARPRTHAPTRTPTHARTHARTRTHAHT